MRIAFVVNGTPSSPMGERARAFASRLAAGDEAVIIHRDAGRLRAIGRMLARLRSAAPDVVYVLDIAYSGIAAALLYRTLTRVPLVVDTGDAITELARSLGRGVVGRALSSALERVALARADHVVVRGTRHAELLRERGSRAVTVIQDGVDPAAYAHADGAAVRARLGLGDAFVVGLVGSSVWSPTLGICYGWELVELLRELPDARLRGMLVGDGSGIAVLRERAERHGVADRLVFAGRVPSTELPSYLAAMDVAVTTQTNDVVGQVRTTGKLPLYLAAGRRILASDVGEASLVLDDDSRVPYEGLVDAAYPARLAARVRRLMSGEGESAATVAARHRAIAAERFDYDVLAGRVRDVIAHVARPST